MIYLIVKPNEWGNSERWDRDGMDRVLETARDKKVGVPCFINKLCDLKRVLR